MLGGWQSQLVLYHTVTPIIQVFSMTHRLWGKLEWHFVWEFWIYLNRISHWKCLFHKSYWFHKWFHFLRNEFNFWFQPFAICLVCFPCNKCNTTYFDCIHTNVDHKWLLGLSISILVLTVLDKHAYFWSRLPGRRPLGPELR